MSAGRLFRHCLLLLSFGIFFPGCLQAQDFYESHDRIVKQSVYLFGYSEPVRIRVTTGFGSVESSQPFVPAVICADSINPGGTLDCFAAKTKRDVYFDDPHVNFVDITDSHQAVLFSANLNYSGSGATWLWSLLVLDSHGMWDNMFPEITSSNQSEHLFWRSATSSPYGYGIFTVADFIWAEGETHFATHRYEIRSYEYCPSTSKYVLADQFTTRGKFPGLDDVESVNVIRPELPEIKQHLRKKSPATCSSVGIGH